VNTIDKLQYKNLVCWLEFKGLFRLGVHSTRTPDGGFDSDGQLGNHGSI